MHSQAKSRRLGAPPTIKARAPRRADQ
jgi:hypothetical protein